jgi:hypothetical protein
VSFGLTAAAVEAAAAGRFKAPVVAFAGSFALAGGGFADFALAGDAAAGFFIGGIAQGACAHAKNFRSAGAATLAFTVFDSSAYPAAVSECVTSIASLFVGMLSNTDC